MVINGRIYSDEHPTETIVETELLVQEPEVKIKKPVQEPEVKGKISAQGLQPNWNAELGKCRSKKELVALYNRNKEAVDNSPELKQLFSTKRKEFNSEPAAEQATA